MKRTILSVMIILVVNMPLQAQMEAPPAEPKRQGERRLMERVDRLKKVRMIEMLELTEDQSARFIARLNEHETKRRELASAKHDALDRIDRLVRNHAEDKELEAVFVKITDLNAGMVEEGNTFFLGLKDLLSTTQRARLLLFERQFERELRDALREAHRKGVPPGD